MVLGGMGLCNGAAGAVWYEPTPAEDLSLREERQQFSM